MQTIADVGQLTCRELDALLLRIRALPFALRPLTNFFELTCHLLHGLGESCQLAGDGRYVFSGCHAYRFQAPQGRLES